MTDSEFERYVELYLAKVHTAALYYLKNKEDAEDVAQNVFLKLYTYTGSFNDDEHVRAWLLRCAVNECKNLLHSHWYRYSRPLDDVGEAADGGQGSDDRALLHILKKLGRNNRIVLYMYYYEGYSCSGIAEIMGISEAAVSARLRRGRKQLKMLIEKELNDNE